MRSIIIILFWLFSLSVQALDVERVLELEVHSTINPATYNYLQEGFKKAQKEQAELILIKLNTPGGLVNTTKDILELFGRSQIPVAVWIYPEGGSATSAGAIICSGAHFIFMSPGSNIGAATPIQMSGDIKETDLRKKAINDLVALVESLAKARGKNPKHFAEMVTDAKSFEALSAQKMGIVDHVVSNEKELYQYLNGQSVVVSGQKLELRIDKPQVIKFEMDLGQKLLNIFANPNLTYILFLIGAALVYFELQAPGGFIAGALGVFALILAGIGFQVLPLNFGALALLVIAFVMFILEVYVTSFGILSLIGIAALVTGSLFLFRTDESYIEVSSGIIWGASLGIGLFMAFLALFLLKDMRNKKRETGFNTLRGKPALVMSVEKHGDHYLYQVKVGGEIWRAFSQNEYQEGDEIDVISEDLDKKTLNI